MSDTGRENDPFAAFESDRTVIKPGTGRGAQPGGPGGAPQGQAPGRGAPPGAPRVDAGGGKEAPLALDALMSASLNPLVSAASPLLSSAPRIRAMVQHPNPAGLKEALADGIRKFEQQARAEGLPNEQVIAARYILCTLLDESAASTPWGGSGVWSGQSLLVLFHNETWGGEKVFQLMSKLAENVPANRNLLELMYVALAFGFEGRYRVLNDGKAQLDSLRARLSQMLRGANRADNERRSRRAGKACRPRWRGCATACRCGWWPSLAGLVLLGVYLGLTWSPEQRVRQRLHHLAGPRREGAGDDRAAAAASASAAAPRLATFLKSEVDQGLVQVSDLSDRSIVIIKGDGFFEPGSSVIAEQHPAAARPDRRRAEGDAGHGADHRPHRQPADPHPALSVQLAPLAGPRQRGQDGAHGIRRQARAHARRGQGRRRAGRPESDARGPRQEPARRDHPHRSFERSMNTAVNVNTGGVNVPVSGVGKFLRFLIHPLFLALIGVIAVSALIWYVGPLIAIGESRPLDPTWIRLTVIAVLFGLWILRVIFRVWSQRRANAALVEGMTKGPSSADKEIATLNQRFSEALDVLKKTPGKGKGAQLYQLPWYIFIGAPGSGKTTALMNAGLTFPLAEKMGGASVRGVGGTRNCDWWFTDEAVLIDTAGRYTTQESNTAVDASAWDGFLALLRKSRPRRPINGVLLTVNIQDLLQQTPVERKEHAAKLRARIQELHEKLGVRPPVYVLVTKADLIAGFNESFGALNKEERNQVWGFSFPYAPTSSDDPLVNFGSEFAALEKRLRDRVVPLMDAEHEVLKRAAIFNFPQQFAGLRGLLGGFLEQVFSAGGSIEERPLLRGVYFTSGTQEGTPIDRVLGTLSRTFGIERRLPPPAAARGKSFFLNRLLKDVVFNEQGLVGENQRHGAPPRRLRVVGFAAVLVLSVGAARRLGVSYSRNKSYIAEVEAKLPDLKKAVDAMPPATSGRRHAAAAGADRGARRRPVPEFPIDKPPLSMSLGLYQGRKLDAAADVGYQHLLDHALMPAVVRRLEERLRAVNKGQPRAGLRGAEELPDDLHAGQVRRRVVQGVRRRRLGRGARAHPRARAAAGARPAPRRDAHPRRAAAGGADGQEPGRRRARHAGRLPARVPRLQPPEAAQIGADIPPFSVAGAAGPESLNVFERASGGRSPTASRASSPRRAIARRSRPRSTRRPASSLPRKPGCSACGPRKRTSRCRSARRTRSS
jgi:type VI secretion system protein ImpL